MKWVVFLFVVIVAGPVHAACTTHWWLHQCGYYRHTSQTYCRACAGCPVKMTMTWWTTSGDWKSETCTPATQPKKCNALYTRALTCQP